MKRFITVKHVYPPRGTSSLEIEEDEPTLLRVIRVIPHGIQIGFDAENRHRLRIWLDALDDIEAAANLHEHALREGMRLATKELEDRGAVSMTRGRLASLLALAHQLGQGYNALTNPDTTEE